MFKLMEGSDSKQVPLSGAVEDDNRIVGSAWKPDPQGSEFESRRDGKLSNVGFKKDLEGS